MMLVENKKRNAGSPPPVMGVGRGKVVLAQQRGLVMPGEPKRTA